jgi:hypothetical protein
MLMYLKIKFVINTNNDELLMKRFLKPYQNMGEIQKRKGRFN